jgi:hypothetical protein
LHRAAAHVQENLRHAWNRHSGIIVEKCAGDSTRNA